MTRSARRWIRLAGLTTALAFLAALILVFITEIEATKAGLGFLLWEAFQLLDTKQVFAGVVTFGLLGVASTWLLQWLERVGCPWIQRSN